MGLGCLTPNTQALHNSFAQFVPLSEMIIVQVIRRMYGVQIWVEVEFTDTFPFCPRSPSLFYIQPEEWSQSLLWYYYGLSVPPQSLGEVLEFMLPFPWVYLWPSALFLAF